MRFASTVRLFGEFVPTNEGTLERIHQLAVMAYGRLSRVIRSGKRDGSVGRSGLKRISARWARREEAFKQSRVDRSVGAGPASSHCVEDVVDWLRFRGKSTPPGPCDRTVPGYYVRGVVGQTPKPVLGSDARSLGGVFCFCWVPWMEGVHGEQRKTKDECGNLKLP